MKLARSWAFAPLGAALLAGGGKAPGSMGEVPKGVGAMGTLGIFADLYFVTKNGPCAVDYAGTMQECQPSISSPMA